MTLNNKGQNAIEYLLVFTAIIIVLLFALSKDGFVTKSINESLEISIINGLDAMINEVSDKMPN